MGLNEDAATASVVLWPQPLTRGEALHLELPAGWGRDDTRLTLTSAPIKSISDELGFSSDSNLRRMFKELTELTPAAYRQRFARF